MEEEKETKPSEETKPTQPSEATPAEPARPSLEDIAKITDPQVRMSAYVAEIKRQAYACDITYTAALEDFGNRLLGFVFLYERQQEQSNSFKSMLEQEKSRSAKLEGISSQDRARHLEADRLLEVKAKEAAALKEELAAALSKIIDLEKDNKQVRHYVKIAVELAESTREMLPITETEIWEKEELEKAGFLESEIAGLVSQLSAEGYL